MSIPDSYRTLTAATEGLYKDKGSKFIACACPVKDLEEIKFQIDLLKEQHPKARHICYAYRLGFSPEESRSQDDGEPAGSAGKPILNTILSLNLHFTLVAVVRYFGGTLLGVPGLIHAYKEASAEALHQAEIVEIEPLSQLILTFPYADLNEVMKICKKMPIKIVRQEIDNLCKFELSFPIKIKNDVLALLGTYQQNPA
jgi:uncharacterized YigZ family protein